MGKTDTITKDYLRRSDIFADVFNQFLYHGQQKIMPDKLVDIRLTEKIERNCGCRRTV